jgi:L-alanine-DL-glutamate epimerase-like enolase superfamily enzyme
MRITDVRVTLWEWRDIPPVRYTRTVASSQSGKTQMGLIRISTDEGVDGYAFMGSALGSAQNLVPVIVQALKPMLMGEHPLARERIWQTMMRRLRGQYLTAISAVDVALWDLAGRYAGVPVHRLIGSYRNSIPAYASSAVMDTPEAYARKYYAGLLAG